MRNDLKHFHLFTHAGCMDGSASAILFMHAGGEQKNVHYVNAGRVEAELATDRFTELAGKPLLFVDVCPSTLEGVGYLQERGDVTVIDHHKSSIPFKSEPGFYIDVDNSACGCENFRRWLVKNGLTKFDTAPYRRMCAIVDDHDRWKLEIPFSLELPKFLSFVGQKDFVERFMDVEKRFGQEKESYWTPFEEDLMKLIRRIQERTYRKLIQKFQVRERMWSGRKIKIAYLIDGEVNNSELLNLYLKEHPEVDIAAQINFELQKVSLRYNGKVDLSVWAKQYGGGGHADAAGHPLPPGLIMGIIEDMHV